MCVLLLFLFVFVDRVGVVIFVVVFESGIEFVFLYIDLRCIGVVGLDEEVLIN